MNYKLIKRIEKIESTTKEAKSPKVINFIYEADKNQFQVQEFYDQHIRRSYIDDYKNYVFPVDFKGNVILDLITVPEKFGGVEGGLFTLNANEIRNSAGVPKDCGFKLEFMQLTEPNEGMFLVTPCWITNEKG